MFHRLLGGLACVLVLTVSVVALADTLKLKDGTTLQGSVIKFGDKYRVKLSDGTTKMVPVADVATITKGDLPGETATPSGGSAATPDLSAPATPVPVAGAISGAGSATFQAAKQRASNVEAPVLAVTIWEKFIDANPESPDIASAKAELANWQKLQKDNAEKINGKWVGGEERKKILKKVADLCAQARSQMDDQTLQALDKYETALKLYPNCFEANFAMGYYYLRKGAVGHTGRGNLAEMDKAIKSLETAVRLRPNSASALSNLSIGYNFRQKYETSVLMAYKAAKIQDSKELVENLVNCLVYAPDGMKTNNKKIKPVIEEAFILAQKYSISVNGTGSFHYLPPEPPGEDKSAGAGDDDKKDEGAPGIIGNGSGFLISSDGYIITNRHVVAEKNRLFRVRFDDGTEKSADVVAIDKEYDIALIKIKTSEPLPYLRLAPADAPNPAAKCMILGYPVANILDFKMQVTSGEVTSVDEADPYHVTLTGNTTHGNSGGPIVDRDMNIIGVLSAGVQAYNATYIKALSAGQIREFLDRCRDKYTATIEPGKTTDAPFDGEKLAGGARKATLLVLIIRGDGKEDVTDTSGIGKGGDDAPPGIPNDGSP